MYLLSYLGGEALNTVSGLILSDANYKIAKDYMLTEPYGKDGDIIKFQRNISQLNVVPNSTKRLRTFLDELKVNLRSLQCLGKTYAELETLLVPIVLKNYPLRLCYN